jgi:ubiquinone/menaquinone biosynthesis C-methylase UbiE
VNDFNKFPNKYIDEIDKSDDYYLPVWQELISTYGAISQVVDVGCGSGKFSSFLFQQFKTSLIGVDGNEYALAKAKNNDFEKTFKVENLSSSQLPLQDISYEFVFCRDVLEYLMKPMYLLGEINRILKPGGKFLVHVPNHFPILGRIKFLLNNNIDPFCYYLDEKLWDLGHIRFFTFQALCEMLSISGFKIIKDLSHHFPAVPFSSRFPFIKNNILVDKLIKKYPS